MSGAGYAVSVCLVVMGTVIIVAGTLGALTTRQPYTRLHLATTVTSAGGPFIAAGLCVANGIGLTTASILLPTVLIFFTSPVLNAAIARTIAQKEGRVSSESPE